MAANWPIPAALVGSRSQKQTFQRLLDHLVRKREQLIRYGESKRLCRIEIDSQIEFGRNLDRQLSGCGAAQNAIHVTPERPIKIAHIRPVSHQTSLASEC